MTAVDVDGRSRLEREKEFLLRSLDDLERERAAGDVDAGMYTRLRADYTARAAAVIRLLRDGVDDGTPPPRPAIGRRVVIAGSLVALAVLAAFALTSALGSRRPGTGPTGNDQIESTASRAESLEADVAANPDDPGAVLAYARFLSQQGNYPEAIRQFDVASALDPTDPEGPAYSGWLVFRAATATDDTAQFDELTTAALERVDRSIAIAEDYPDAHFFRGAMLMRARGDPAAAVPELQRYLSLAPETPLAEQVRALLDEALRATGSPATPSPTAPEDQETP